MVGLGGILFSMIGWLIFVICFGSFNNGDNFYNDVRENRMVRVASQNDMRFPVELFFGVNETDKIIEEDFPKNRADTDFFSFYFFAVVFPVAALLTIAHLVLHGLPVVGFIISLVAHVLLTVSFICGSAVWFAEGNRLFSKDNNFRNEYGSIIIPEDWLSDSYWGAWLVGEWVGVLIAGIGLLVYYTVTPFFSNPGDVITRKQEAYEMDVKK